MHEYSIQKWPTNTLDVAMISVPLIFLRIKLHFLFLPHISYIKSNN